jgi:hypothetical protein
MHFLPRFHLVKTPPVTKAGSEMSWNEDGKCCRQQDWRKVQKEKKRKQEPTLIGLAE